MNKEWKMNTVSDAEEIIRHIFDTYITPEVASKLANFSGVFIQELESKGYSTDQAIQILGTFNKGGKK